MNINTKIDLGILKRWQGREQNADREDMGSNLSPLTTSSIKHTHPLGPKSIGKPGLRPFGKPKRSHNMGHDVPDGKAKTEKALLDPASWNSLTNRMHSHMN